MLLSVVWRPTDSHYIATSHKSRFLPFDIRISTIPTASYVLLSFRSIINQRLPAPITPVLGMLKPYKLFHISENQPGCYITFSPHRLLPSDPSAWMPSFPFSIPVYLLNISYCITYHNANQEKSSFLPPNSPFKSKILSFYPFVF